MERVVRCGLGVGDGSQRTSQWGLYGEQDPKIHILHAWEWLSDGKLNRSEDGECSLNSYLQTSMDLGILNPVLEDDNIENRAGF